jgi:hypothetical protein
MTASQKNHKNTLKTLNKPSKNSQKPLKNSQKLSKTSQKLSKTQKTIKNSLKTLIFFSIIYDQDRARDPIESFCFFFFE